MRKFNMKKSSIQKRGRRKFQEILWRVLCLGLAAILLTGCSFSFDDWYFVNGKWLEDVRNAHPSDSGQSDRQNTSDSQVDGDAPDSDSTDGDATGSEEDNEQDGASSINPWWDKLNPGDYEDLSFDEFLKLLFEDSVADDTLTLHFFLTDPETAGITPGPANLGLLEGVEEEETLSSIEECRKLLESYSREEMTREQRITADTWMPARRKPICNIITSPSSKAPDCTPACPIPWRNTLFTTRRTWRIT